MSDLMSKRLYEDTKRLLEAKDAEIERLRVERKLLRRQKQIAIDALFGICQSDWGIGHSIAKPAHKAIKELAATEQEKSDE